MTTAGHRPDPDDDALFAELAEAATGVSGPVSVGEREAAAAARERVCPDSELDAAGFELAALAFDSVLDDRSAVREGASGGRQLTFYADDATLHLDVTADLLVCRVEAAQPAGVALLGVDGRRRPLRDIGGATFELTDPPPGSARLECRTAGAPVRTSWFRL